MRILPDLLSYYSESNDGCPFTVSTAIAGSLTEIRFYINYPLDKHRNPRHIQAHSKRCLSIDMDYHSQHLSRLRSGRDQWRSLPDS